MIPYIFNGWFYNPFLFPLFVVGVGAAIVWSLVWKGIALWKAANKKDKWWFIALLVINTLGILEIAYIFYFSKRGGEIQKSNSGV